jgi:hypothetical protein
MPFNNEQSISLARTGCPASLILRRLCLEPTPALAQEVLEAEAVAICRCEVKLRENDPVRWLERRDKERVTNAITAQEVLAVIDRCPGLTDELRSQLYSGVLALYASSVG